MASAVWLIDHMCSHLGIEDLGDEDVLDVGCGVKFTQAFLDEALPVRSYVGVDVYREMVDFLNASVDDPRFEYVHIDARNDHYNPGGRALRDTGLSLGGRTFDVICLFSVFTHLGPDDYRAMLELLRPHVREQGRLFFTLFIDEVTEGGHGLMDAFARDFGPESVGTIETFRDLDTSDPLKWAVYSPRFARELIDGTGWEVVELSPPEEFLQHHFVCAPT